MTLPTRRLASGLLLTAVFALGACTEQADPTASPLGPQVLAFAVGDATDNTPELEKVKVCKVGNVDGTFDFEAAPGPDGFGPGGVAADGLVVATGDCTVVAEDAGATGFGTFLTVTENPDDNLVGVTCQGIGANDVLTDCTATYLATSTVFVNSFHGIVLTFDNFEEPPPPPECVGLTPGYWKNWANHYTEEEFLSLLPGTIAEGGSAADAVAILSYGGPDPVQRLAKFVLANQLTINLTGTDLPNPSGGSLHGECGHGEFEGETLGGALEAALAVLADPGSYSKDYINWLKSLLDAFANLGDD
jgi:hypothetical protein